MSQPKVNILQLTGIQAQSTIIDNVAALSSSGIITRTGSGTVSTRTITGTNNTITLSNGDGVSGNPTITIADNAILPGTGAIIVPAGSTGQRPTGVNGQIRYNSSINLIEGYQNSGWTAFVPVNLDIPGSTSLGVVPIPENTAVFSYIANKTLDLPISLTGSQFSLVDLGGNTGTKTFTIAKVVSGTPTNIGTIAYASPYTGAPTITFVSAVSFAVGDILTIKGSSTGEGTFNAIFTFNLRSNL